jgi:hypothetical protein
MKIVSQSFGGKISIFDIPYINMVDELIKSDDLMLTSYYKYIYDLWEKSNRKVIWEHIKSKADILRRTETFKKFAQDIITNGFDVNIGKIGMINNKPYGKITVIKKGNEYVLIDGHHRISVLIYMGIKKFKIIDDLYLIPIK